MNIVITGPTGAIGHALIEECLNSGDEVLAICHKSSQRISSLPKSDRLRFLLLDLSEYSQATENINKGETLEGIASKVKYDVFYHLAWNGTVGNDRNDIILQDKNVGYSLDAVRLAKALGCDMFIGAGSQAEYGRVEGILKPDTPVNPENEYGKAKLKAGNETRKLCNELGMKHIWTRVLSVYGPYDGERSMIISSLRKMLLREKTFYTKGEQIWDYLYSEDAGKAFRLLAEKGIKNSTYVIGSGKVKKIYDYICIMAKEAGYNDLCGIGAIDYSEKQVMHLQADISKLTKDTGFVPSVDFDEGIKKTINYLKNN